MTTSFPVPEGRPEGSAPIIPRLASATDLTDPEEDTLWGVLLDYIEEGTVVPVLGRDLLLVETPDPSGEPVSVLLYTEIARELARALTVTVDDAAFEGTNPLGAVASEFIVRGGAPTRIYSALPGVFQKVDRRRVPSIPEALRKLAEIDSFRVFVTTTFDPLLRDCLGALRGLDPSGPGVMAYTAHAGSSLADFRIGENRDRTLEILNGLPAPVLVHILGKLSNTPNYVVTEEDAFEFVYSLQETRPEGFMDLLAQMKLLIVGCRFPTWLVRFFLRTARRRRLLQTALDRTDFVVDAGAAEDAALVQFLRNFRTQTEIFTRYTPAEFVDELHRRWTTRRRVGTDASTDFLTPSSIFVSYASEDAVTAANVAEQIGAEGMPVWFDRGRLGSGDEWARKIRRNIDRAAAVVVILSRSSTFRGGREFRREWRSANEVRSGLPQNEPFIYPLVIDDVSRSSEEIDDWLKMIDWDAPNFDGKLPKGFIDRLRRAYRQSQMRSIRG